MNEQLHNHIQHSLIVGNDEKIDVRMAIGELGFMHAVVPQVHEDGQPLNQDRDGHARDDQNVRIGWRAPNEVDFTDARAAIAAKTIAIQDERERQRSLTA